MGRVTYLHHYVSSLSHSLPRLSDEFVAPDTVFLGVDVRTCPRSLHFLGPMEGEN